MPRPFAGLLGVVVVLCAAGAQAEEPLQVAAYDLNPYVSADRSEHGYLYEIVQRAFAISGHKLVIHFYPPARAKVRVETGQSDLLIPSYASPDDSAKLLFSQPIHGSQVGYVQLASESQPGQAEKERSFAPDTLFGEEEGVIRSSSDQIVRVIDLLAAKRIRLAVADKFQVADALVNHRPNLIGKLMFVVPALATKHFEVAISRKHPRAQQLLNDFNRGLEQLRETGEYERILIRYGYQLKPSDPNTLNVGAVANFDFEILKEMSDAFTAAHPGVKIRWYTLEENLLRRTVLAGLALNENIFDLVTIGNYDSPIYAANGWIDSFDPPASYAVEDLLPAIRKSVSYRDRLHALPFYGESSITYYRRDLFEAAGLSMPAQPTYAQLRAFAEKLHHPSKGTYGICLRGKPGWGENIPLITTMVNVHGGSWFDAQREPALTTRSWANAINTYVDLLKGYGPPRPHERGFSENLKLFAAGKCAIWIDATVAASYLLNPEISSVADHTAFAQAPVASQSQGNNWLWTWALAVPQSSNKKALAKEFALWATSPDYIQAVAQRKGWLSVPPGTRHSTYASPPYQQAAPFGPLVEQEIGTALAGDPVDAWGAPERGPQFVAIPEFTALGTSTGINISLALQGRLTVAQALEFSQQDARRIMKRLAPDRPSPSQSGP
jgi:sorbitol/mannitol transport system substrate-binding protein